MIQGTDKKGEAGMSEKNSEFWFEHRFGGTYNALNL